MTKNVYVHIPFCKQKCKYCSFVSFPKLEQKDDYIGALLKEVKHFYKNEELATLYFGGGTPSLLSPEDFRKIIGNFNITPKTEVTIEVNPETVTDGYFSELRGLGVNRLSFGCQTFDEKTLELIGRKHSPRQVKDTILDAQKNGFNNISLDLIYGLPNQTINSFENDLKEALALEIQHVSLYGLKIDEGCYFYNNLPKNLPDSDLQAEMYLKAIDILTSKNFEHYEISNFSKNGCNSRHNLNYWENNSYYGFGIAAHGYVDGIRYSNRTTLKDYINNPLTHKEENILSDSEKLEEEIFLGFRKTSGLDVNEVNKKYNIDFEKKYSSVLGKYLNSGHMQKTSRGYKLTTEGILVSNIILADFLE